MNEKINGLWDQASGEFCKQNPYATIMLPAPLREKFAELLVEEACRALHPMLRDQISRGQGVDLIKKHFNGEEE
jgi:hypothetical protein